MMIVGLDILLHVVGAASVADKHTQKKTLPSGGEGLTHMMILTVAHSLNDLRHIQGIPQCSALCINLNPLVYGRRISVFCKSDD